jgi:hypothetical protein
MPEWVTDAEDDERVDADELTDEAARIAEKILSSFGTRKVNIYGTEPLHIGVYGKRHATDAGLLSYLQIEEKMAITTAKRRADPYPNRCETNDGNVSYIEARPIEHVAGLYD